ncbi:hypothetical protein BC938DRAFT_472600 [Jimgerdemannia flammicorona]|uniref:WWE domain-containing protein n=1 Tax=Jimgerdemannia flammicorona TaxID=994334 RepID=A0A433Q5S1_9FUNG|nr:hypothetical protein BC938DRAFT_472600 [Jimgerdemannia flammicorona]
MHRRPVVKRIERSITKAFNQISQRLNNKPQTVMRAKWVYAAGTEWVPFEAAAQQTIESLWDDGVGYGWTKHLGENVYIHFDEELYVVMNGERCLLQRTVW